MIKYILLIIFAGCFIFQGCTPSEPGITVPLHKSTLVYMVADNDLDYYAAVNIRNLEETFRKIQTMTSTYI
jgi:hypothetical protein